MKVRDLVRLLESDGWRHVRTTRSHRHIKNASKPNVVTVPGHLGDELPMKAKYAVIFERAESNWAAYVPDLPGCITTGKTLEETERNIRDAIEGHLSTLRQVGEPVPGPTSLAKEIEVSTAA